jgi:hypothetical protein
MTVADVPTAEALGLSVGGFSYVSAVPTDAGCLGVVAVRAESRVIILREAACDSAEVPDESSAI